VRLVEFSGRTVERAGGEPVRGARVSLQAGGTVPVAGGTLLERPVGEDGGFRFDLIQPDRYMLLVYRGEGSKALPWALPVEVGKTGVEDREIVVPRFPPLRVAIKVKSGEGWGGQVLFTLRSRLAGVQDVYATITSDQFALDEVPPGQWRVNLESNAVRRPELQHVTVAAARFGDVDALSDSITVTESGNPVLEVELSADTGRIAGTVAVESGRLPLVFMRRIGAEGGPLSGRSINVKPDGNFLIEDLAPGKYEVLAMGRSATRLPPAKPVEVKAGETAVVDLR